MLCLLFVALCYFWPVCRDNTHCAKMQLFNCGILLVLVSET